MNYSQKVKIEIEDRINITDNNVNFALDFNFRKIEDKRNMNKNFFDLNFDSINNQQKANDKLQISDYLYNNISSNVLHDNKFQMNEKESSNKINNLNELRNTSSVMMENDFIFAIKLKFKERLNEMKTHTESILENIRSNFNTYVDDQKSHLINSLNTIENLFDVDSNTTQCENEKIKQLEKKMAALSNEINGLINDLLKFTK